MLSSADMATNSEKNLLPSLADMWNTGVVWKYYTCKTDRKITLWLFGYTQIIGFRVLNIFIIF